MVWHKLILFIFNKIFLLASRIGRQSNLFKERLIFILTNLFYLFIYLLNNSIRKFQNDSTSMATITDSASIASMAKKRKTKTKIGKGSIKKKSFKIIKIFF